MDKAGKRKGNITNCAIYITMHNTDTAWGHHTLQVAIVVIVRNDTMGREIGLGVMEHVADGFTLSVQELVNNLLMEIGSATSAERYYSQCYAAV